jgi:hypothetical protein
MKKSFLVVCLMLTCFFTFSVIASAQSDIPESALKVDYKAEIQELKDNELNYELNKFSKLNKADRINYSKQFSLNTGDAAVFKETLQNLLETAYVYYLDENGNLFDKDGYIDTFDISGNQEEKASVAPLSQTVSSINGANTGAFVRQLSVTGYRGIYSQILLPTNANSTSNYISMTNGTGFLYNRLYYSSPTSSDFWDMEAGLHYSTKFDNYAAYIRVHGAAMNPKDINGNEPPRFKSATTITQNLRYDGSKIRYYANGTNINNTYQALIFGVEKTFSNTSKLRVGRVTGIGYDNYDGTQSVGKVNVTYSNVKFLKNDGTEVTPTSSLLDSLVINNITYGTVDWPATKITKTPSTGSIGTQTHTINAQ